jgi:phage terminase large subunit GpA-like protein
MFASVDRKLAVDVIGRTYRMLELCPALRDQLRPPSRRKQDLISLAFCRQYVAWSRSVSTLADKAVRVGHANEVDKWEHPSTSREADPLELFFDRFKEFPNHKRICESTPQVKFKSRVEGGRLASTNCAYYVPCPLCSRYQALRLGEAEAAGGIAWEKTPAGKSEKELTRKTAHYVCEHCRRAILDQHRGPMMRAGVWIPAGCGCDDEKAREATSTWLDRVEHWDGWRASPWITGTPHYDGRDSGYQLSSLYALSLSWGDIAEKFVYCKANPQNLRNFVNQWLGETWQTEKRKATWDQVAERLVDNSIRRGVCPKWASIVTVGVDRQQDNRFPWVAIAWGPERRAAIVGYGEAESLEQIGREVLRPWPNEDGGNGITPCWTLIDSGYRPSGVYEFCKTQRLNVFPAKGSSTGLDSDYRESILGANTASPGMRLFLVDTIRSQLWADKVIHDNNPKEAGGLSIFSGSIFEHEDFVRELLNDAAIEQLDQRNNARENWERIETTRPNDKRDCLRYAYVAMLLATRGGAIRSRTYTQPMVIEQPQTRFRELKIRR